MVDTFTMTQIRGFLRTSSNRGLQPIIRQAGIRFAKTESRRITLFTAEEVARILEAWHATRTRWRTTNRRRAH